MLCSLSEVMKISKEKKIAIGAFNGTTSECVLAVLKAAEELDLPVILMHAQCHEVIAPIDYIGPMIISMAKASKAKVCVHLDHGEDIEYIKKAIELGFNSVMIDASAKPYEENISITKEVVDYAHLHNVEVEAELGALPNRESSTDSNIKKEDLYTKVELVNDFINRTNIDALAIAFGTAHGLYKSKPILNMDVISNVRKVTDIPLVMHGGSGISFDQYKEVIKRGINKINYYTYMSYAGYERAKQYIKENESDYLHNLSWQTMLAMKENVKETMKVFANIDN